MNGMYHVYLMYHTYHMYHVYHIVTRHGMCMCMYHMLSQPMCLQVVCLRTTARKPGTRWLKGM